jgi:uncharacterized protein (TIGR03435 family)
MASDTDKNLPVGAVWYLAWLFAFTGSAFAADDSPQFEAADVHVSASPSNAALRVQPGHGGRYEARNARMVDLIRVAYGYTNDKIIGGPTWLEMDRFDVTAKVPAGSTPDAIKLMLQELLAERFRLLVHKDTRLLPGHVLRVGKKLQLKTAEGTGDSGCKQEPTPAGAKQSEPTPFTCTNMTMAAFADWLRGWMRGSTVVDETELKGQWNFDFRWTLAMGPIMDQGERITIFQALDKQLGLMLEEAPVPTAVLVVDSVDEIPSPNPPGTAEALPPLPVTTEFEVASVTPTAADDHRTNFRIEPSGRVTLQGMQLTVLLSQAFEVSSSEQLSRVPEWAHAELFDVMAKGAPEAPVGPMLRALLVDRFKMKYHIEDREVFAYSLVSVKPKPKKADPASRASCSGPAPPIGGSFSGSWVLTCRNVTMAQFAARLRNTGPGLYWPVVDATGIEGRWDFGVTFTRDAGGERMRGGDADQAPDPSGSLTIFEALEKQLGLKLEKRKRTVQMVVIDHLEQKPTEN